MKSKAINSRRDSAKWAESVMTQASLLVLTVLLVAMPACSGPIAASKPPQEATAAPQQPLRIFFALDQSASMTEMWCEPVTVDAVRPLVACVQERGGEIAFMVVRSNSAKTPEVTFRSEPSPEPPKKPEESADVYDAADTAKRYRRALVAYEAKNRAHKAAADAAADAFLARVVELLQAKPDRVGTDLGRAHARAARFLGNPDPPNQLPAERIFLVQSDGKDTVGAVPIRPFPFPVRTLLVTPGDAHALAPLDPQLFSSLSAATHYLRNGGR